MYRMGILVRNGLTKKKKIGSKSIIIAVDKDLPDKYIVIDP